MHILKRKKVKWSVLYYLVLLSWVINFPNGFAMASFYNSSHITNNPNCSDYEGTIQFSYNYSNDTTEFSTQFILTDTNNVILQTSMDTSFTNVVAGCYFLYFLDYKKTTTTQGNNIGSTTNAIAGDCFNLSVGLPITICKKPDAIKTVSGLVFNDRNEDGIANDGVNNINGIQLLIYEDNNRNGEVDSADTLLANIVTNNLGEYSYTFDESTLGRLITHIVISTDSTTIPTKNYYTTDNIETAIFSTVNGQDTDNNFGISQQTIVENEVWLDINANGIQEPLEINIPNMSICISNLSPLLVNGILYPPNTYLDTIYTDLNGIYVFDNLPDCDWQIIVHYDNTLYFPTYDADGGILGTTNFTLMDGEVLPANNSWCLKADCINDLDFGFRLAGNLSLSGNICIDDWSKDGNCSTGGEVSLANIKIELFTGIGDKLGGITVEENGMYYFPYLPEGIYIVDMNKEKVLDEDYLFTTKLGDTPASKIVNATYSILQKVTVEQDVFEVDFAFFPHVTPPNILARDDFFTLCPGAEFENIVTLNDSVVSDLFSYKLLTATQLGKIELDNKGFFNYSPSIFDCSIDQFTYQLCDLIVNECDTATVSLVFQDNTPPSLTHLPSNITMNCDEQIPSPGTVSAFDNCPRIGINVKEISTQGEDGCSLYDFTLTRIWEAIDLCGNKDTGTQIIKVKDLEAPNIFRIYTLPNGKKMVAGVTTLTGEIWKTIPFPLDFPFVPLVFNQIISNNETTPAIVQTRNVSKAQFEIKIQEEEANDGRHLYEKVAWIAIEKGISQENFGLVANLIELDHQPKLLNFPIDFSSTPALFTTLQTTNELDPVLLKHENLIASSIEMSLVEETSKDIETTHAKEQVAYFGIETIGDLKTDKGEIIGEVNKTTINSGWNTIQLNHNYHNPVILVSNSNDIESFPYTLSVKNVSTNNFEVQVETWDYLISPPTSTAISYIVIEGSIPLYPLDYCRTGADGLILGQDMIAIDNCDNSVDLTYSELSQFNGLEQIIERKWSSRDECGNEIDYTQQITCEGVGVKLHTYLQGALIGSETEGLMRDNLRKKQLIPRQEPYTNLPNFQHAGAGGGELLNPILLDITGADAIVDWVLIELRAKTDINKVITTSSALLQRDGDIISAYGDSIIVFRNIAPDDYYISIRHRNHIGLSTQNLYTFNLNTIPEIDFRNVFTPINGQEANVKINNRSALWSGDLNGDGQTIYQGPNNDPFQMFLEVILDEENTHFLTNYISTGYTTRDFNLDGRVIYQGPNNDKANLLIHTTLNHPNNPAFLANFVISVAEETITSNKKEEN